MYWHSDHSHHALRKGLLFLSSCLLLFFIFKEEEEDESYLVLVLQSTHALGIIEYGLFSFYCFSTCVLIYSTDLFSYHKR